MKSKRFSRREKKLLLFFSSVILSFFKSYDFKTLIQLINRELLLRMQRSNRLIFNLLISDRLRLHFPFLMDIQSLKRNKLLAVHD